MRISDIARRFNISRSKLYTLLDINTVPRRKPDWRHLDKDRCRIIEQYNSGMSCQAIADCIGCDVGPIHRLLDKHGVVKRKGGPARVHMFDEHFFRSIDSEAKAYWLGFLAADGNVMGKPRCQIRLRLACQDVEHVKRFALDVGYGGEISITKPAHTSKSVQDVAGLSLNSVIMVTDLIRHGVTPNKTLTYKPWLDESGCWQAAYWRGYFDGDGSIYTRLAKYGKPAYSISAAGTKLTCDSFLAFIKLHIPHRFRRASKAVRKVGNIYSFLLTGRGAIVEAMHLLYGGATVALQRKHDHAKRIMLDSDEKNMWCKLTAAQLYESYIKLGTWEKVARRFGIGTGELARMMHKRRSAF